MIYRHEIQIHTYDGILAFQEMEPKQNLRDYACLPCEAVVM